jgi:hypothetical protein
MEKKEVIEMNAELREAFKAEMTVAVALYQAEKFAEALLHLETAHVLGQKYVGPHIATHYWMLKVGVKRRSLPEVVGQTIRIVLGAAGSAVGIVPVGNTGGTNIGMFKRLPIDPGIRHLLR